jgi:hypothetical protein
MIGTVPWPVKPSNWFSTADAGFRTELEEAVRTWAQQLRDGAAAQLPTQVLDFGRSADRPVKVAVLMIDAQFGRAFPGEDVDAEMSAMKAVLTRANQNRVPVFEVV